MNELKKAIFENFIQGIDLYFYQAPKFKVDGVTKIKPPYCVYQFINDDSEDTFSEQIAFIEVQFNVYSKSSEDCSDMAKQIKDYYFANQIPIENRDKPVKLNRIMGLPSILNKETWQATNAFEVII